MLENVTFCKISKLYFTWHIIAVEPRDRVVQDLK